MGLVELPYESELTRCCPPCAPSWFCLPGHWHCSRRGGPSCRPERKILNCLIRSILTEPRAVVEDQPSRCRTSEGLVTLFVLHSPVGLQEQMAFGSNSQLGALSLPGYAEDTGTHKAFQKCVDTDSISPPRRNLLDPSRLKN